MPGQQLAIGAGRAARHVLALTPAQGTDFRQIKTSEQVRLRRLKQAFNVSTVWYCMPRPIRDAAGKGIL